MSSVTLQVNTTERTGPLRAFLPEGLHSQDGTLRIFLLPLRFFLLRTREGKEEKD